MRRGGKQHLSQSRQSLEGFREEMTMTASLQYWQRIPAVVLHIPAPVH